MTTVLAKYQADFGTFYVQVPNGDGRIELSFDHEPSNEEIDAVVATLQMNDDN